MRVANVSNYLNHYYGAKQCRRGDQSAAHYPAGIHPEFGLCTRHGYHLFVIGRRGCLSGITLPSHASTPCYFGGLSHYFCAAIAQYVWVIHHSATPTMAKLSQPNEPGPAWWSAFECLFDGR